MRKINFRAWDNGLMYQSAMAGEPGNPNVITDGGRLECTERVILMQYTGLKDKNGKEIYEGDVVCADLYSAPNFEVVYFEGAFRLKDSKGRIMRQVTSGFEVIGNIYETPNLLQ